MNKNELKCEKWYNNRLISLEQFNAALCAINMLPPNTTRITMGDRGNVMWLTYIIERYTVSITQHQITIGDGKKSYGTTLTDPQTYKVLLKRVFSHAEGQAQVQTVRTICNSIHCSIEWVGDWCILTNIQEAAKIVIRVGASFTRVELHSNEGELLNSTLDLATAGVLAIVREVNKLIAVAKRCKSRPIAESTNIFSSDSSQPQDKKGNQDSMSELIERRDVMRAVQSVSLHLECPDHIAKELYCAVASLPAANMQQVAQGEWKINPDRYYPYCSICGVEPPARAMTSFCPNCGSKMGKPTGA